MAKPPFVYRATEANFQTLVVENSFKGPVLVDFWAAGVGPSLRQAVVLARLAEDYRGRFLLVSVDTDSEKGIASRFGVRSLPSCKLFRRGVPVEQVHRTGVSRMPSPCSTRCRRRCATMARSNGS